MRAFLSFVCSALASRSALAAWRFSCLEVNWKTMGLVVVYKSSGLFVAEVRSKASAVREVNMTYFQVE